MNPLDISPRKNKSPSKKSLKSLKSPKSVKKRKRVSTTDEARKQRKLTSSKGLSTVQTSSTRTKSAMSQKDKSQENMPTSGTSSTPKTTENATIVSKYFSKKQHTTPDNQSPTRAPTSKNPQEINMQNAIETIMNRLLDIKVSEKQTKDDMSHMMQSVESKLESIQKNMARTEQKMDNIEQTLEHTSRKIDVTDRKIDSTIQTIDTFKQSLEYTQTEVDTLKKDVNMVKEKVKTLEVSQSKLSETNNAMTQHLNQIHKEKNTIQENLDSMENYSRKENMICEWVPERPYEKPLEVAHRIFQTLKLPTPPLHRCHRLGPPTAINKPRPFIIRFVNYQDKIKMFQNARHLRGTKIILKDDICRNTQRKQAALKPILALAKHHDNKARFINEKILFHGQVYGQDDLNHMPLETETATCRKGNGVTIFSGELCPLSNLHPITLFIDGKPYASSEHYYQTEKCLDLGNERLADQVYHAVTAREAMDAGKTLRPTKEWSETTGAAIMTKAAKVKFQNEKLQNYLLATTGAIGEGTQHPVWGIGVSMHTHGATLVNNWTGSNLMGKILTELREDIQKGSAPME